jgi:hypothetical protein
MERQVTIYGALPAMPAPELRLRRQLYQRPHRTIRAQNSVGQLEYRVAPCRQAP